MDKCADCISTSDWPCHTTLDGYPHIHLGCKRDAQARYADSGRYTQESRDLAPDGRPLMVQTSKGWQMYETYCKPQRDGK